MSVAAIKVIFLGDSDMSKWPSALLPSLNNNIKDIKSKCTTSSENNKNDDEPIHQVIFSNYSRSGDLLSNVPNSQLPQAIAELKSDQDDKSKSTKIKKKQMIFLVACAGENDISSGQPIDTIIQSFNTFIHSVFTKFINNQTKFSGPYLHLIFFGPKLEPWLDEDMESRKLYYQLSERMLRVCASMQNVTYIDCLTMFCSHVGDKDTDKMSLRSGILSGKTKADKNYFSADGLHLNIKGYEVWKEKLEMILTLLM